MNKKLIQYSKKDRAYWLYVKRNTDGAYAKKRLATKEEVQNDLAAFYEPA